MTQWSSNTCNCMFEIDVDENGLVVFLDEIKRCPTHAENQVEPKVLFEQIWESQADGL